MIKISMPSLEDYHHPKFTQRQFELINGIYKGCILREECKKYYSPAFTVLMSALLEHYGLQDTPKNRKAIERDFKFLSGLRVVGLSRKHWFEGIFAVVPNKVGKVLGYRDIGDDNFGLVFNPVLFKKFADKLPFIFARIGCYFIDHNSNLNPFTPLFA